MTSSLFSAIGGFSLLMISFLPSCQNSSGSKEKDLGTRAYNVLFIAVDDWNDQVGCMGDKQVITPNLDRLAAMGTLFTNAHCSAPICNPSRASIYSGLLPSSTGIYNNAQPLFATHPDIVSLPRHFRKNGYRVEGGGKTYHEQIGFNNPDDWDYYFLWDESNRENGWWGKYSYPPAPQPDHRPVQAITSLTKRNFDWAPLDIPDSWMPDYKVASWARYFLSRNHKKPFFLAPGIFKPHVPWFVPGEYFDLYPLEHIQLPPYLESDLEDVPATGVKWAKDAGSKHQEVMEMNLWEEAIRAYYASITHSDRQVGRILDGLLSSSYSENTIIVLWSDHGYHLGEKDHWHKFTLWEESTHVPLIIVAPGITEPGTVCDAPVSLLDLYPTLVDLCGLPANPELEGHSLLPLLLDPEAPWEHVALTTHGKNNHAVRSKHFRYIRYADGTEELYDHRSDPNEWENLANEDTFNEIISDLKGRIPRVNAEDGLHKTRDLSFEPSQYKWSRKSQ